MGLSDTPLPSGPFEDIIDGYFPLRVSIAQLMTRRGVQRATLTVTHAPIMFVPGLGPDAPVPLNIRAGRAGMIDRMTLQVVAIEGVCVLQGEAAWRWLDGTETTDAFDPLTRLAEPAVVEGVAQVGLPNEAKAQGRVAPTADHIRTVR